MRAKILDGDQLFAADGLRTKLNRAPEQLGPKGRVAQFTAPQNARFWPFFAANPPRYVICYYLIGMPQAGKHQSAQTRDGVKT